MALLTKLVLAPDNSSYSVRDGKEVVSVALDGGAGRYRRDILGASSAVSVQWICDREEYHYLRSFYRALLGKGAKPFLIDLILDDPLPMEHKAYFVPGSMALTAQRGLAYYVSAELEVEPTDMDEEAELNFATMFSNFGPDWETVFPPIEDEFNTIVNTDLPAVLP